MKRVTRQRGFTLVELLLAAMLTSLIAVSTVVILRSSAGTRRRVNRQMALQQEARAAVRAISTALRNAYRPAGDPPMLEGIDAQMASMPADRVRFFTVRPGAVRQAQPESDVKECEFFLNQVAPDRPPVLMQRLDPTRNAPPDGGGVVQCVAENIIGLDLAYYDGRQWRPDWPEKSKRWPVAVRINLIAVDPEDGRMVWPVSRVVNFPRTLSSARLESKEGEQ